MSEAVNLGGERRVPSAGSPEALGERRSRGVTGRRPVQVARFLLTWVAAFLMIIALFSAFGRQFKAMSAPGHALLVSYVFVVTMDFLVMPGLAPPTRAVRGSGTQVRSAAHRMISHRPTEQATKPGLVEGRGDDTS